MLEKTPSQISKDLQANLEQSGVIVSASTIRCTLNQTRLYGQRPRKTPFLIQGIDKIKGIKRHRQRLKKEGLLFVKEYLGIWENVLWTDEKKIELFGNANQQFVYRWCNEAHRE